MDLTMGTLTCQSRVEIVFHIFADYWHAVNSMTNNCGHISPVIIGFSSLSSSPKNKTYLCCVSHYNLIISPIWPPGVRLHDLKIIHSQFHTASSWHTFYCFMLDSRAENVLKYEQISDKVPLISARTTASLPAISDLGGFPPVFLLPCVF